MRARLPDLVLLLALLVALGATLAPRLLAREPAVALVPLPPDRGEIDLAVVGEVLTIEDLARVSLETELGAEERAALGPVVEQARQHRQQLLQMEAELRAAEAELDSAAREVLELLDPEQQRWILDQRDRVSVGEVEEAYWVELARRLEEGR